MVHLDLDGSGLEADDGGADDARNDASKHPPTDFTGGAPIVPMRAHVGADPCARIVLRTTFFAFWRTSAA